MGDKDDMAPKSRAIPHPWPTESSDISWTFRSTDIDQLEICYAR